MWTRPTASSNRRGDRGRREARPRPRLNEIFDWIDSQIDGRPYLLGETFSAADLYRFMLTRWGRNLPRKAWTLPSAR